MQTLSSTGQPEVHTSHVFTPSHPSPTFNFLTPTLIPSTPHFHILTLPPSTSSHPYTLTPSHPHTSTPLDIEVLHEREDWQVHAEEGGIITSLPILFENRVVEVLLTLKEIVLETNCRETEVGQPRPSAVYPQRS